METPGQILRRLWTEHNARVMRGEYPRTEIYDRVMTDLISELKKRKTL